MKQFKVGDLVRLKPNYYDRQVLYDKIKSLGHEKTDGINHRYYDLHLLKEPVVIKTLIVPKLHAYPYSITPSLAFVESNRIKLSFQDFEPLAHYYPGELFEKYDIKEKLNKILKL